jgi:hypothetical protein
LGKAAVIDAGIYDDRVAGAMDDFDPDDNTVQQHWHRTDLEYDSAVGGIHEELERRKSMMGPAYPFKVEGGAVTYQPSKNLVYEFCLAICNSPTITAGDYVQFPRVFERLSANIFQEYLGNHSIVLHTGSPRDPETGSRFRDAMINLGQKSGEWIWKPEPDLPEDPEEKDGGVDFVAWKDTLDNRKIGQLFVLGQCACGNDWNTKFDDISLKKFRKWFQPSYLVQPVRTFVIPFVLADGNLKEASREAGLVFDRARLTLAAQATDNDSAIMDWLEKLKELICLVKQST